jgi:sec-independent protein translocase protein TatA
MNIAFLPNLAGPDGIMILIIILLLFGAKKLPELARGMGQAVREFSKAKDEVHNEITRPPASEPERLAEPKTETPRETQTMDSHTKVV